jgi:hypothetical protein
MSVPPGAIRLIAEEALEVVCTHCGAHAGDHCSRLQPDQPVMHYARFNRARDLQRITAGDLAVIVEAVGCEALYAKPVPLA